jgi:hypothetical protein
MRAEGQEGVRDWKRIAPSFADASGNQDEARLIRATTRPLQTRLSLPQRGAAYRLQLALSCRHRTS